MIGRFKGEEGRRRIVEALSRQATLGGDKAVAAELADCADLKQYAVEEQVIAQGDVDNDICFVLAGTVNVLANGRVVATRHAGQHVGEMALIDPMKPRSASIVAREDVVVARVSEAQFVILANRHPFLWRNLACELADRLRQRNTLIIPPNPRARLFIGCSTEGLPVARELQSGLRHDPIAVKVWTDDVFGASRFPIEDLEREVSSSDFGLLLLSSDDLVKSRRRTSEAPRDNVVFELGLFMGALGRLRTLFLRPRGSTLKIPSDLLGITALEYDNAPDLDLTSVIAPVCQDIRKLISSLGTR